MKFLIQFLICLFCVNTSLASVQHVTDGYFRSPVDVKMYLSGTFGEPRTTHFHTGLDIKTEGVEGKKIYAVADGYISRIGVSPYGYGNALYITHPNGLVSVYGHLQKFDSKIQAWVKQKQHEETNFALNLAFLEPNLFPVKKGEVIALSGNSGGSGGPHLHFEIRDSLEHPLNPLLFGFDKMIVDDAKPSLSSLSVYNLTNDKHFTEPKKQTVTNVSTGVYKISTPIMVNRDEIGFGIQAVDLFTGTSNRNGVYKIALYDGDNLCYEYQVDELNFDYGKHVYSHCDYWAKRNSNQTIHKCFVEKGNKLNVYPFLSNFGKITLSDESIHYMKIAVSDFNGNTSILNFQVKKAATSNYFLVKEYVYNEFFPYNQRNSFKTANITLDFPNNVLFDDLYFQFAEKAKNTYGSQFIIHSGKTPLANYFDVTIKLTNLNNELKDKYLIAYYDYANKKKSVGGKIHDQFIQAKTREFGTYFIDVDTIAPVISALNISEGKTMTYQKMIQFKATDDFAGIEEYNAFVNGSWVVLEYDAKRALFSYVIDESTVKGSNDIEVVIADGRANASSVKYNFIY